MSRHARRRRYRARRAERRQWWPDPQDLFDDFRMAGWYEDQLAAEDAYLLRLYREPRD